MKKIASSRNYRMMKRAEISARDVATGAAAGAAAVGAVIAAPVVIPAIATLIGLGVQAATVSGAIAASAPITTSILLWLAFSEDEEEAYHEHYSRLQSRGAGVLGTEIKNAVSGGGTKSPQLWAALELLEQRRASNGCRAIRSASAIGAGEGSGQHEFWKNVKSDLSGEERNRFKAVYDQWHSLGCTRYSFEQL